jgi:hypothetical protein
MGFDASIAHVGGSPDGLAHIRSLGARDLDEFANADGYWRITTRYSPHNVYTNTVRLDALEKRKGYTSSTFTSLLRKPDRKRSKITARQIDLDISGFYYSPHYVYDAKRNAYKRSEGGEAHRDDKTSAQLEPKVVVALVTSYGIAADGHHSIYGTTGSGHVFVFQDGVVVEGTWQKASPKDQITFSNANGEPIKLNAGQTWITAVDSASDVSYKP